MKVLNEVVRMKSDIPNDDVRRVERLAARLERSIDQLESIYA